MTDAALSIHARMVAILGELPAIGKTEWNEQQKFHYRGFDAMLTALNPLLAKHGVFVVPDVVERATAQRTTRSGSVMHEVNLHVRFTFYGLAGDSVEASGWGEGTDMGDKATNKAMTAAFKYVLNQAFAISNSEAADSDAGAVEETVARGRTGARSGERAPASDPLLVTPDQVTRLHTIAGKHKVPKDEARRLVKEWGGVDSSKLLPRDRYDAVVAALEAWTPPETSFSDQIPVGARGDA